MRGKQEDLAGPGVPTGRASQEKQCAKFKVAIAFLLSKASHHIFFSAGTWLGLASQTASQQILVGVGQMP
jgi:hypothetical protein